HLPCWLSPLFDSVRPTFRTIAFEWSSGRCSTEDNEMSGGAMKIVGRGATDVGKQRGHNEDFYLIDEPLGLYIVCDGMGGHAAGEVASQMAAEHARDYVALFAEEMTEFEDTPSAREQLERIVRHAIDKASRAVYS